MGKVSAALLMIVIVGFGLGASAGVPLSGPWEVNVRPLNKPQADSVKTFTVIKRDDEKLTLQDPIKKEIAVGKTDGKSVQLPLDLQLPGNAASERVTLEGEVGKDALKGRVSSGGKEYEWKARRLPHLWACSNHSPIHLATSGDEMRELSKQKECTGWHAYDMMAPNNAVVDADKK